MSLCSISLFNYFPLSLSLFFFHSLSLSLFFFYSLSLLLLLDVIPYPRWPNNAAY